MTIEIQFILRNSIIKKIDRSFFFRIIYCENNKFFRNDSFISVLDNINLIGLSIYYEY